MRVPGRVYATEKMLKDIQKDKALEQVVNVAYLPGIQKYSIAMPDIHWGYGFPIGGVAAMDAEAGVISPGGVGYDIHCGVRLPGPRPPPRARPHAARDARIGQPLRGAAVRRRDLRRDGGPSVRPVPQPGHHHDP